MMQIDKDEMYDPQNDDLNGSKNSIISQNSKNLAINSSEQPASGVPQRTNKARRQSKLIESGFISELFVHKKVKTYPKANSLLTQKISHIIKDRAENQKKQEPIHFFNLKKSIHKCFVLYQIIKQCIICIFNLFPTIKPESRYLMFWKIIVSIANLTSIIYLPISFIQIHDRFYEREDYHSDWVIYNITMIIIFGIEILVQFNVSIYQQGELVKAKKAIYEQYAEGIQIYLDIIPILPHVIELSGAYNYIFFLSFIGCFKIFDTISLVHTRVHLINKNLAQIITLIKLSLFVYLMAHVYAIIWEGISTTLYHENVVDTTWIHSKELQDEPWDIRYIYALYFSITTMTTVGYGDISATNKYEAIQLMILMILGTFMFATIFSTIGSILSSMNEDKEEFKKQMTQMKKFLLKKNAPKKLHHKVQQYLKIKHSQISSELTLEEQNDIKANIPKNLLEEIQYYRALSIINQYASIFGYYSKKCTGKLIKAFEDIEVKQDEIIYKGEQYLEDPCFYFIEQGEVQEYVEYRKQFAGISKREVIYKTISKNKAFGKYSFLSGMPEHHSVRALTDCQLYRLKRSDFLQIIKEMSCDLEIFKQMETSLKLYGKEQIYAISQCSICDSYTHFQESCPFVHLSVNKESLIIKELNLQKESQHELRQKYIRKRQDKKNNSLLHKKHINERANNYQMDEEEYTINLKEMYMDWKTTYKEYDMKQKSKMFSKKDGKLKHWPKKLSSPQIEESHEQEPNCSSNDEMNECVQVRNLPYLTSEETKFGKKQCKFQNAHQNILYGYLGRNQNSMALKITFDEYSFDKPIQFQYYFPKNNYDPQKLLFILEQYDFDIKNINQYLKFFKYTFYVHQFAKHMNRYKYKNRTKKIKMKD